MDVTSYVNSMDTITFEVYSINTITFKTHIDTISIYSTSILIFFFLFIILLKTHNIYTLSSRAMYNHIPCYFCNYSLKSLFDSF